MPCRGKARIEAPEGFVASGPFGGRLSKDPSGTHECHPGALGLLPSPVFALSHTLRDTGLRELGAVVEL